MGSLKDKIQDQLWDHIDCVKQRTYGEAGDHVKEATDPSVWSTVWRKVRIRVRAKTDRVTSAIENQIYYGDESDNVFP